MNHRPIQRRNQCNDQHPGVAQWQLRRIRVIIECTVRAPAVSVMIAVALQIDE